MYTVELPLTAAEVAALEAMAAVAPGTVGDLVAVLIREELDAAPPLRPNLG